MGFTIGSTAYSGISTASNRMSASADRVARQFAETPSASLDSKVDIARESIEQTQAKTALTANVGVFKTADTLVGSILNITA